MSTGTQNQTAQPASLYYSILLQLLWGTVNGTSIRVTAVSGGRAGSTTPGAVNLQTANNPLAIGVRTNHPQGIHGGPLPIGEYQIGIPAHNPHLGWSARLTPMPGTFLFGTFQRDGFFIHGRGPHGSDGCVVLTHPNDLTLLLTGLEHTHGGTLIVTP